MGLFDGIKRTLNIGGCNIGILTENIYQPQGSEIFGEVLVRGGSVEQSGKSIAIELEEFWTETRYSGTGSHRSSRRVTVYSTRDRQILKVPFSVNPGDEISFPFNLQLPPDSRLSTSSTGWGLKVSIDIPNAIDPRKGVKLQVVPAREFMAIVEVLKERFDLTEKRNSWRWTTDNVTQFRMLPGEFLRDEFDYIAFKLSQVKKKGGVRGKILFNLQEKSFKDYLKAMLFMDRVEKVLILKRSELFLKNGALNYDGIENKIRPIVEALIKSRNEYEQTSS